MDDSLRGDALTLGIATRMLIVLAESGFKPSSTHHTGADALANAAYQARKWVNSEAKQDARASSAVEVLGLASSLMRLVEASERGAAYLPELDMAFVDGDITSLAVQLGQAFSNYQVMFSTGIYNGYLAHRKDIAQRTRGASKTNEARRNEMMETWGEPCLKLARTLAPEMKSKAELCRRVRALSRVLSISKKDLQLAADLGLM